MTVTSPPLAEANERLRGKPGRPRTRPPVASAAPVGATVASVRRLLDVRALGAYLSIGERRARELVSTGIIPRVRVPLANGGELRRLLVDRECVDRLITAWREPPEEAAR